ncbi:Pectinesterase inhibitor domain [Dillenia turbinata]|uniref:pectinesterase n=1 Tax=Dillenia turbinata TaxID=194707 RepID=A0AAN8Z923_9MAGN
MSSSINYFAKGYNKVGNDLETQSTLSQNPRKRLLAVVISAALLLSLLIGTLIGTLIHESNEESGSSSSSSSSVSTTASNSIKSLCNSTLYPDSCFSSISSFNDLPPNPSPQFIFKLSLRVAVDELSKNTISKVNAGAGSEAGAVKECKELLDDSLSQLNKTVMVMNGCDEEKVDDAMKVSDMKTWMSAALTDQETCLDGLEETNSNALEEVKSAMKMSKEYVSNCLAIAAEIFG